MKKQKEISVYERYPNWKCITTKGAKDLISLDEKQLKKIKNLEDKCFICGRRHIICGGWILYKLDKFDDKKNKIIHIYRRHAPLGCFLSHRKKEILKLLNDKEFMKSWRVKEKE